MGTTNSTISSVGKRRDSECQNLVRMSTLRLQSSDGKHFDVAVNAAQQSTTTKTMLEDTQDRPDT